MRLKTIPIKYQKIIVWIPYLNVLIYPAWYYNFFVLKAGLMRYFVSWLASIAAAVPWICLGIGTEGWISWLLMNVAVTVIGLVLIRFQEKIL